MDSPKTKSYKVQDGVNVLSWLRIIPFTGRAHPQLLQTSRICAIWYGVLEHLAVGSKYASAIPRRISAGRSAQLPVLSSAAIIIEIIRVRHSLASYASFFLVKKSQRNHLAAQFLSGPNLV
jgi:hypothetical protein